MERGGEVEGGAGEWEKESSCVMDRYKFPTINVIIMYVPIRVINLKKENGHIRIKLKRN